MKQLIVILLTTAAFSASVAQAQTTTATINQPPIKVEVTDQPIEVTVPADKNQTMLEVGELIFIIAGPNEMAALTGGTEPVTDPGIYHPLVPFRVLKIDGSWIMVRRGEGEIKSSDKGHKINTNAGWRIVSAAAAQ